MTIILKEAARRRITRRRTTGSNDATREYSRRQRHAAMNAAEKAEVARKLALMDELVEAAREYSKDAPLLSDWALSRAGAYEEPQ